MCFSAGASFGAGVVLSFIGIASVRKSHHSSQVLFASIPLIFGVQQFSEGILWLTLPNPDYLGIQRVFTYVFLLFAQIIWPVWVPIAVIQFEKKATRNDIQKVFVAAGIIISTYLAYCLLSYHVESSIIGYHISYKQDYPPAFRKFVIAFYGIATILPPFFSHIKRMWMFGAAIAIAYIVSAIFYEHYVLSVWCFFSSIISISIYAIIVEVSNTKRLSRL